MTSFRLTVALALAAGLFSAQAGRAATPPANNPASAPVAEFEDWAVRCFPVKSPAPCDVFQMDIDKKNQRRVSSVSIAYAPGTKVYVVQIIVPLGVSLQRHLLVEAGQLKSPPMVFRRCEDDGCYVEGRIADEFLKQLAAQPDRGALVVQALDGRTFRFPLSTRGLAPALARLKAEAEKRTSSSP